jgi:ABC-type polysaccharide transport system, permease component
MGKKTTVKKLAGFIPFYVMMIPGIIYIIINNYIPMSGIVLAFKRYDYKLGMYRSKFIGFENFTFLFKTKEAFNITKNTLLYNAVFIILGTVAAIAVAIILNDITSRRFKKLFQTCILVPYLISMVVVSYIVYGFLNSQFGFINKSVLEPMGIKPVSWYSTPEYWPFILVFVNLWKYVGYNCIIYYASIVGIDRSYYEAAEIDGAGKWQQIKYITLPSLKTTIIILTLMAVGRIFYSDFGLFYQVPMNSGALIDVTNTIDTYVYRGLTQMNNIGMAAAAGFYQSVVGFVLIFSVNQIVRKMNRESALF